MRLLWCPIFFNEEVGEVLQHDLPQWAQQPATSEEAVSETMKHTVKSLMALADEYAASCSNGNTLGDNPLRAALREALAQPAAEPDPYQELLYAVSQKYPGETRHETALRYIRQAQAVKVSGSMKETP